MYKFLALCLVACLMVAPLSGCATNPVKPPTGCETSIFWNKGLMPYGPTAVKSAFYFLTTYVPQSRGPVKVACTVALDAVSQGNLRDAITNLADVLNQHVPNPLIQAGIAAGVAVLTTALPLPNTILTDCDRAIMVDLLSGILNNIPLSEQAAAQFKAGK